MSPNPAFPFACFAARRGKTGKREVFIIGLVTPGGATLARGYYHIVPTGLRLGSLRSLMAELSAHRWRPATDARISKRRRRAANLMHSPARIDLPSPFVHLT